MFDCSRFATFRQVRSVHAIDIGMEVGQTKVGRLYDNQATAETRQFFIGFSLRFLVRFSNVYSRKLLANNYEIALKFLTIMLTDKLHG